MSCVERDFRRAALAALLVIAADPASAVAARPVAFACSVEGAANLVPPARRSAVCARFRAAIERAIDAPVRSVRYPARGPDWIAVQVRFPSASSAEVVASRATGGQVHTLPGVGQSVSDRSLGPDMIDQLAGEVARRLASGNGG